MTVPDCVELLDAAVNKPFADRVAELSAWPIRAEAPAMLQLNLGYRCNQRCAHCHVAAGPERDEQMSDAVLQAALAFGTKHKIHAFDLTGGAPELHPKFRWLVTEIRARGASVIDRCNLTILSEPGQEDLADFLAEQAKGAIPQITDRSEQAHREKTKDEHGHRRSHLGPDRTRGSRSIRMERHRW